MKNILVVLVIILLLAFIINFPLIAIGLALVGWATYEYVINKKLKAKSKKIPAIFITGLIVFFIGVGISAEKNNETKDLNRTSIPSSAVSDQENKAIEENNSEEELKAQEEAERLAAEQKAKEEAARLAEEQRKKDEEAQRLAEEQRQKEEADRLAEEQRKKEEEQRLAEEQAPEPEPAQTYESYKNCTALNAVYPNGVDSSHPAYASKHDRDKDGWACEQN